MISAIDALDAALAEVSGALSRLRKVKATQVRQVALCDFLKSIAYSWFRTHRVHVESNALVLSLDPVNEAFQVVLSATEKAALTTTHVANLKAARVVLTDLRAAALVAAPLPKQRFEDPPDFAPLVNDPIMKVVLTGRWIECQRCIQGEAYLAATVMIGGLLEALFVARANRMDDKSPLVNAKRAPQRKGKTLPLQEWTLRPYVEVGEELGWITTPGKLVAAVITDYRNYVHPEKERSHAIQIKPTDADMFWQLAKSLTTQLLRV